RGKPANRTRRYGRTAGPVSIWKGKSGRPSNLLLPEVTALGSIVQFTPAMRIAVAALILLSVLGLGWRAIVLYQADQRALKAAAFLAQLEAGAAGSAADASPAVAGGTPGGAPDEGAGAPPARQVIVHVEG